MVKMSRWTVCVFSLAALIGCAQPAPPSPTPAVPTQVPREVSTPTEPQLAASSPTTPPTPISTSTQAPVSTGTPSQAPAPTATDQWGGFYDHVLPPTVDVNGYGLRVPGLVISPYAKKGYIDHQTLSFDAYLKFIEDDFLGGQRLDPTTDGRPDPRPDVRENATQLGNLINDFDFTQDPRPSMILPTNPKPGPASIPGT